MIATIAISKGNLFNVTHITLKEAIFYSKAVIYSKGVKYAEYMTSSNNR